LKIDLMTGTGNHQPDCDNADYPDLCIVRVEGVAIRIRGDGDTVALNTLSNGRSFAIVPSLKSHVERSTSPPDLMSGLLTQKQPADPVAAYFEIDGGGVLAACPFSNGGFFGNSGATCDQFASDVFWDGDTTGAAVLQLAYKLDGNGDLVWYKIRIANKGPLRIDIANDTNH